jgi:hypothetical protein
VCSRKSSSAIDSEFSVFGLPDKFVRQVPLIDPVRLAELVRKHSRLGIIKVRLTIAFIAGEFLL